jgi:peptide/nickel transport system substrate-binding protein
VTPHAFLRVYRALSYRERLLAGFGVLIVVGALLFWMGALYITSTRPVADSGGEYREGIASQPRYINPIIAQTSDADQDLVELVYSGLMSYDQEGKLIKRLAADYRIEDDGKRYVVTLRQGVRWHDGEELTADDVLYTVQTLQDPSYKSPLRANWLSVETQVVDRYTITFTLKKAYFGFLENLTVGILPKHIWEGITPDKFLLADYNLSPVGSGPYRFYDMEKDSSGNILSMELRAFKDYFEGAPYIPKFIFSFYPDQETLLTAYGKKEVLGIHSIMPAERERVNEQKSTHLYRIAVPRVFSVFVNTTKSKPLAYDEVRTALAHATDREAIVREVLGGEGVAATSAFLPFMEGYAADVAMPSFDLGKANKILDDASWKKGDDGIRAKDDAPLEVELTIPTWPEIEKTADLLKNQWEQLGVRVNITPFTPADLQKNAVKNREYQSMLFGQAGMLASDPYSFWHSSQKADPGLNLGMFDNKDADGLLESIREEMDPEKRREEYKSFQQILANENPAVFLYSPNYLYVVNNSVKGIGVTRVNNPSHRLSQVNQWYINTKRVFKGKE